MKNDRKFELVLWPDSTTYDCNAVLLKAQEYFTHWAYIYHDSDIHDDGTPKKPHFHFYGKCDKTLTPSGVCYQLGLPENESSLANVRNWKCAIRYLIHYDDRDKHQYDMSAIVSNFDVSQYFKDSNDDDEQARQIYEFIKSRYPVSLPVVVEWVLENHLWSAFRRGYAVWSQLIGGSKN